MTESGEMESCEILAPQTRKTGPLFASRRCGARTRGRKPCRAPAIMGKARCRMHGGAEGSGAQDGNCNALRHGGFTREALEELRRLRKLIREAESFLEEV